MALYYEDHLIGQEVIYLAKVCKVIIPSHLTNKDQVRLESLSTGIMLDALPEDLKSFKYTTYPD